MSRSLSGSHNLRESSVGISIGPELRGEKAARANMVAEWSM